MNCDDEDIDILSTYYNISKNIHKNDRVDMIAREIYNQHYLSSMMEEMTSEEESRLIAEQAERRRLFQERQARWRRMLSEIETDNNTNGVRSETKDCYSTIDFFTQESFNKEHLPIIHIRYINYVNDIDNDKTDCYAENSLFKYLNDKTNTFAQWIQEYDALPELKRLEPEREFKLTKEGYNGTSSITRTFVKIPDKSAYFIDITYENEELSFKDALLEIVYDIQQEHPEQTIDTHRYNAFLVAKGMRVGNLEGTFYASQTHGQLPGYNLYYLLPEMDMSISIDYLGELLMDEVDSIQQTKFIRMLPDEFKKSFLFILSEKTVFLFSIRQFMDNPALNPGDIKQFDNQTAGKIISFLLKEYPDKTTQEIKRYLKTIMDNPTLSNKLKLSQILELLRIAFSIETVQDEKERETRTMKYIETIREIG